MALFNESLEGRFAKLVTSLHSMKGPNPTPQVAPEIQHAIEIQDEIERFNHPFLQGITRYASGLIVAAADATHTSSVQLLNPAGSGVLVTIERVICQIAAGAGVGLTARLYPAAFTTSPAFGFPMDGRESPNKKSVLTNYINTTLAGVSGNEVDRVINDLTVAGMFELPYCRGIILPPDKTNGTVNSGVLGFQGLAVNTQVAVAVLWRERAANPAELRAP